METAPKIRWGVLSTARIATEHVIPATQASQYGEVVAIASREPANAEAAATRLGIARAYGSYDELLADPQIDAIYNPLPNHLHVPWSIRALEAGKHVLCEKPLAPTVAEATQLLDASKSYPELKVMEAFMYKFHPQWHKVQALVQSGAVGELRTIQTFFSYFLVDPSNIRNVAEMGGGGLLDIGCYAVSVARLLFQDEPLRVLATTESDPRFAVDRMDSAILEFSTGTSTFTCATQLSSYQRVGIHGTTGWIEMDLPFNATAGSPPQLRYQRGSASVEELPVEAADQYSLQADGFAQAILNHTSVPTPLEDALANLAVIEAVFQSAKTGRWAEL